MSEDKLEGNPQTGEQTEENNNNTQEKPTIADIINLLWQTLLKIGSDKDKIPEELKHIDNKEDLVAALHKATEEDCTNVKGFIVQCGLAWEVVKEKILSQKVIIILQLWHSIKSLRLHAPDSNKLPEELAGVQSMEELVTVLMAARETDNPRVKDYVENSCGLEWDAIAQVKFSETTRSRLISESVNLDSKQCLDKKQPGQREELSHDVRPYKEVLSESSGTLVDCLQPTNSLLDHLERTSVINSDMVQKVRCRPNRTEKVRVLLQFLMGLGPESLSSFIGALRATQQYSLANILAANNYT